MNIDLIKNIKEISGKFWLIQFIQMIERLVYAALVLQMAVYIAQKDIVGGLNFEHTDKGIIFFFWALVQNLTPVFSGGFIDKYGRKKVLILSIIITSLGFIIVSFQTTFYSFLFSVLVLGFGFGLYRPSIYGLLATHIKDNHSSVAWGLNVMLINFAVFFSPPLAKYLEEISWQFFFIGLAVILILSIFPLFLIKVNEENEILERKYIILKDTFREFFSKKVFLIVTILSGFMMIYMQFYETLPNFIYDWIDTSNIVKYFNLPEFMTMQNSFGKMIDFKWLYNFNSGFIVIAVVFVSWFFRKYKKTTVLSIGLIIATFGIVFSGLFTDGKYLIIGMLIYTLGEMITNPKFTEFMSSIAPIEKKSMYMGFINFSMAIGLAGGSLIGGYLYKNYCEKTSLAIKYLNNNYKIEETINHSNAINILMEKTNYNYNQITNLLWNEYNPYYIWFVFGAIGIISIIFLYLYSRKFKL